MSASRFRLSCLSATLFALSAFPALAEPLTIDGSGISRDVHCAGDAVEIHGEGNTIKLTGECASVTVGGIEQTVDIQQAGKLDISGSGHKVTAAASGLMLHGDKSEVTATIGGGAEAVVDISGGEHVVDLALQQPTQLEVQGVSQKVTWAPVANTPEPRISISGADNKVDRKK